MGAVVSCVSFHPFRPFFSPNLPQHPTNIRDVQIQSCFRTIGRTIMAIINGIGSIIMAIVNGIVTFLDIIVGCLTCQTCGGHRRHRGTTGTTTGRRRGFGRRRHMGTTSAI